MARITFDGIDVKRSRKLELHYVNDRGEGLLVFESNQVLPFDDDSVALAISTLLGRKYDEVTVPLAVCERTAKAFRDLTKADATFDAEVSNDPAVSREGNVLNFSGGFDSLAVLSLMPDDTHLVSMDFGGQFAAEKDFFQTFEPTIITTNIVRTEFQTNSWSMMGIAAILTAPVHRARYMTFGGIIGASVSTFARYNDKVLTPTFPPFAGAGYVNAPYSLGLMEPATTRVIARRSPGQLLDSLRSLAGPGTVKYYRKSILADIAIQDAGTGKSPIEVVDPTAPLEFGQSFGNDLPALYILARRGKTAYEKLIHGAPDELFEQMKSVDIEFFHRINTSAMREFPSELWGDFMKNAAQADVIPYTESDWEQVRRVREILAGAYPGLTS